MKIIPLICAIGMLFIACEKNEDPGEFGQLKSTLVATVLYKGEIVQQGVSVLTDPKTIIQETDAYGQVVFEDIPLGRYEVLAYLEGYASGKTTVELGEKLEQLDVRLIDGLLIEPQVKITSPVNGQGFSPEETLVFKSLINDNITPVDSLIIKWESSVDGELAGGVLNEKGQPVLSVSDLSPAEHIVKLSVTNLLGITTSDSVFINTLAPGSLKIKLLKKANYDIKLSWELLGEDIERIEIFRWEANNSGVQKIVTLKNPPTSFIDTKVPFADSVHYYARVFNVGGYSSISNIVSDQGTPVFNLSGYHAVMDKDDPIIYLRSGNDIAAVNYQTQTVIRRETFKGTVGIFDIGDNGFGKELYVPCSDGWLYIYDLSTFKLKESINVGVRVDCVLSDNNGLLIVSATPSPWWEKPIRIYRRSDLAYVDGGGDLNNTRMFMLPGNKGMLGVSRSTSPDDIDYYELNDTGKIILEKNDPYHGDYSLSADIFKIAPQKDYYLSGSQGAVYVADKTMVYKGNLQRGSKYFSDFEFNNDASVIYAGLSNDNLIYGYDYASLKTVSFAPTRGYVYHMFKKANQLIVISTPEQRGYSLPNRIGIEIIPLSAFIEF